MSLILHLDEMISSWVTMIKDFLALRYYLIKFILYSLSLLPLWVLYRISNGLFFFCYYIIKYRRKIVRDNLSYAFPQKAEQELVEYEIAFYRHFCDIVVETIKAQSISKASLIKRMHFTNPEIIAEIESQCEGSLLISTHYGNFEWMASRLDISLKIPTYGVYTPLKDKAIDRIIWKMRNRYGLQPIPMDKAMKKSMEILKNTSMIGYICDQSPSRAPKLFFGKFLGRPTATHIVPVKMALKGKKSIYFSQVERIKRGYYSVTIHKLPLENYMPYSMQNVQALTDLHLDMLTESIRNNPAYWLWSHRRWKHQPRETDDVSYKLREFSQRVMS